MMPRSSLCALCLVVVLFGLPSIPAWAANGNVSHAELAAQKELLQTQIEAVKAHQQKDVDAINKRIDDQLAMVGQGVDRFGVIVSALGVVITVLLVLGGFIGYRNAKADAKKAAIDSSQKWFLDNSIALKQEIEEIRGKAIEGRQKIADTVSGVQVAGVGAHESIRRSLDTLNSHDALSNMLIQFKGKDTPQQLQAKREVKAYSEQLKNVNEDTYNFDDWDARASTALNENKFEDAAYFWLKASQVPNAGRLDIAKALFKRSFSQWQLGQIEEVIKTLTEIIDRFGETSEVALKEEIARAFNGIGFVYFSQAKAEWLDRNVANALLHRALERFNQAIDKMPESMGGVLGNRAYAKWLLGRFAEAETDFAAALRSDHYGGGELYEATLKDFDIHPIPEDQGMREMVERLWADYQREQSGGAGHA